jgi:hypothetical protein
MMLLMEQCNQVERLRELPKRKASNYAALYERNNNIRDERGTISHEEPKNTGLQFGNPLSVLNGVFPGTKWCGTGDIAKSFHDIGAEKSTDRCCRGEEQN